MSNCVEPQRETVVRSILGKTVRSVLYAKSETDKIESVECPIVWNPRETVRSNLGKTVRLVLYAQSETDDSHRKTTEFDVCSLCRVKDSLVNDVI